MVNAVIGQKKGMRQVWTETGVRLPVTEVSVQGNVVVRTISQTEEAQQVQIAFGDKKLKNLPQPTAKQLAQAGIESGKRAFKEVTASADLTPGQEIKVEEVFAVGDVIKVTGTTKGHGFAGVVKRYGFAGGPKTHGQSDRERAPGAIGQRSTPGRVFKNQRMPGHYGTDTQTLETCVVVAIDTAKQALWIKGTLPGSYNGLLTLQKGTDQNIIALNEQSVRELLQIQPAAPETSPEDQTVSPEAEATEVVEAPTSETQETQA